MIKPREQSGCLGRGLGVFGVVVCLGVGVPASLRAQVLEINETGGLTVHDRPEVTTSAGSTTIDRQVRRHSARASRAAAAARDEVASAASKADLSPDLIEAVAWRESRLRPGVVSSAGAIGEMQLMPGTARELGVDPYVTRQNLGGGASYLSSLLKRYNGDLLRALAAYNAGPGTVDRFGGVPPYKETQDYVAAILDRLSSAAQAPER